MNKFKCIGYIVSLLAITLITGCNLKQATRKEINTGDKKVIILNTNSKTQAKNSATINDLAISRIDKYEGIKGEDWLSDQEIIQV